jgi:hypothetical protein
MTAPLRSDTNHSSDNLDQVEAHIWGELKYSSSGGSYIKVKGTGTEDQEAFVVHGVGGFNIPSNSDAEVLLLSGSSDSNKKWAIPSSNNANGQKALVEFNRQLILNVLLRSTKIAPMLTTIISQRAMAFLKSRATHCTFAATLLSKAT